MAKIFNNHKCWAFDKPNLSTQSLSANVRGLFFGGGGTNGRISNIVGWSTFHIMGISVVILFLTWSISQQDKIRMKGIRLDILLVRYEKISMRLLIQSALYFRN